MEKQQAQRLEVINAQRNSSFRSNVRNYGLAAAIAAPFIVLASNANAGIASTFFTSVNTEVTDITSSQQAMYGALIVVLIGFLIWRYGKRTVNSG